MVRAIFNAMFYYFLDGKRAGCFTLIASLLLYGCLLVVYIFAVLLADMQFVNVAFVVYFHSTCHYIMFSF